VLLQVGNDCSCVAVARKRGIDVLMNKESIRETPAMVSFGDKMRFIGENRLLLVGLLQYTYVAAAAGSSRV
jgi:heat shock protein 4